MDLGTILIKEEKSNLSKISTEKKRLDADITLIKKKKLDANIILIEKKKSNSNKASTKEKKLVPSTS